MTNFTTLKEYASSVSSCSICLSVQTKPKTLPCNHSFCLECIQTYCDSLLPGVVPVCPTCRARFEIPDGGMESLPTNFVIEGLVNLCKMRDGLVDGTLQSTLDTSAVTSSGSGYCTTGERLPTARCCEQQRTAAVEEYQGFASGADGSGDLSVQSSGFCRFHHEEMTFYCQNCHLNLCIFCYFDEQKNHQGRPIKEIYESFKHSLEQDTELVTVMMSRVSQERNDLELGRGQFLDEINQIESSMNQNVAKIIRRVNELKSHHTEELSNIKAITLKEVGSLSGELDSKLAAFNSFLKESVEVIGTNEPWKVTKDYNCLHRRAEKWLKCDRPTDIDFLLSSITLNPGVIFEEIAGFSLVSAVDSGVSSRQNEEKPPSDETDFAISHSEVLKNSIEQELKMRLADQDRELQDKIRQTELKCQEKLLELTKEHAARVSEMESELATSQITCLERIDELTDEIDILKIKHDEELTKQAEDSDEKLKVLERDRDDKLSKQAADYSAKIVDITRQRHLDIKSLNEEITALKMDRDEKLLKLQRNCRFFKIAFIFALVVIFFW